jgi:hypothetical protein
MMQQRGWRPRYWGVMTNVFFLIRCKKENRPHARLFKSLREHQQKTHFAGIRTLRPGERTSASTPKLVLEFQEETRQQHLISE